MPKKEVSRADFLRLSVLAALSYFTPKLLLSLAGSVLEKNESLISHKEALELHQTFLQKMSFFLTEENLDIFNLPTQNQEEISEKQHKGLYRLFLELEKELNIGCVFSGEPNSTENSEGVGNIDTEFIPLFVYDRVEDPALVSFKKIIIEEINYIIKLQKILKEKIFALTLYKPDTEDVPLINGRLDANTIGILQALVGRYKLEADPKSNFMQLNYYSDVGQEEHAKKFVLNIGYNPTDREKLLSMLEKII